MQLVGVKGSGVAAPAHLGVGITAPAQVRAPAQVGAPAQIGAPAQAGPPARTDDHTARVEVWVPDANGGQDLLAQREGESWSDDPVVREAAATGVVVLQYAMREFGRDGIDGRGSALKLRVHAPDPHTLNPLNNNAHWFDDEQRIWLGDGDGSTFAPLGGADDVVAHEFFHGVIDNEVKLPYEKGQSAALHESFADVLATGVDGNWQIAEDVYTPKVAGDAARDLSNLTFTSWRSFPADKEYSTHALSEVPSHAAYLVGREVGMQELRRIWYTAVVDHLRDGSGFAGARQATIAAARALHGAKSTQAQAVIDAWDAVGILADTPKW